MYVLGISCYYHDSSASLIKDGKIIACVEEERFTRVKHDSSFPINSIKFCLKQAKISIDDIKVISFYEKPILKLERVLNQYIESFPKGFCSFLKSFPNFFMNKLSIQKDIKKKLMYKGDITFVKHHQAHAASAYYPSPYNDAVVVTIDGVGEWSTTTIGKASNLDLTINKEIVYPHSIGLLYSMITGYLGFRVNNSEYKVMGLSPYGDMNKKTNTFYLKLKQIVDIKEDGSFSFDQSYFDLTSENKMYSKKFDLFLGSYSRKPNTKILQVHKDIAAALQLLTEDLVFGILKYAKNIHDSKNLVLAGGVALNSVLNGKILDNTDFKSLWVQPNSSDGGSSLGAALFSYYNVLNGSNRFEMTKLNLGQSFDDKFIEKRLQEYSLKYYKAKTQKDLLDTTSKIIFDDKVVGWFQGKMEFGPRALGFRSIIANPKCKDMKDILNMKVKKRETFRPFAPVVCKSDASKYFDISNLNSKSTDFMLLVRDVIKKYRSKLPSITHVDGSGRVQTLASSQNPLFFNLLRSFEKLSGYPILINTSFNIKGEPIVCNPDDAIKCFLKTGIDCLVIGNFIVSKEDLE